MNAPVRGDRIARLIAWQKIVLTDEGREEFLLRLLEVGNLKEVAKQLDLPEGRIQAFLTMQRGLSEAADEAIRRYGHELAAEGKEILDEGADLARDVARANYRKWLAEKLDWGMFGQRVKVEKTVTLEVDAQLLGEASSLLRLVRPVEKVVAEVVEIPLEIPPEKPRPVI